MERGEHTRPGGLLKCQMWDGEQPLLNLRLEAQSRDGPFKNTTCHCFQEPPGHSGKEDGLVDLRGDPTSQSSLGRVGGGQVCSPQVLWCSRGKEEEVKGPGSPSISRKR